MLNGVKRFVLLLALAALPVQGISASFANLVCHAGMGAHGSQVHDGHDHGVQQNGHSDEGKGLELEHSTCHPLTPVLPVVIVPTIASDYAVWAPSSHGLPDLFIPDRPQRPPLA